ncbi:sensor domain-containing diguanylate cyclase [Salinibius halmophilus]|uniref:sensor domain-containing diguanylate cyclase n=1 Tax=Salinibius halmophilus TaxID=1853216 RepID=UPI000E661FAD|nr:sensor domain-containing diguanylate cyclase [Salinibius halmophilus]
MRNILGFDAIRRQIEQNATNFVLILSLATVPLAIILAWALAWSWQESSKAQALELATENVEATAVEASRALFKQFSQYTGLTRVLANLPEIRQNTDSQSSESTRAINEFLSAFTLNIGIDNAFITDRSGKVILTSNANSPADLTGTLLESHQHIRAALAGDATFEFRYGPPNRRAGFYFSFPILNNQNDIIGAATIKVNRETLSEAVQQKGVLIADSQGVVFLSDRSEMIFKALSGAPVLDLPRVQLQALYDRDTMELVGAQETQPRVAGQPRYFDVTDARFGRTLPHLITTSMVELDGGTLYVNAYEPLPDHKRLERELPVAAGVLVLGIIMFWYALTASVVYTLRARWYRQELQASNGQLEAVNRELAELALHDPLTGCANRRGLAERIDEELDRATRYGRPLSVAVIDIDHFKQLNDKFGHQAGDQALKHLVQLIQPRLRNTDFLARAGGEEFVIVMPETTLEAAEFVLERIREVVANESFYCDRGTINMTISVGIACLIAGELGNELIERADVKLYEAKQSGRNRVCA